MSDKKIKKNLLTATIMFLLGMIIFFVSISYVKYFGGSLLLISLIGIALFLGSGWWIDDLKKHNELKNYKEILAFFLNNTNE